MFIKEPLANGLGGFEPSLGTGTLGYYTLRLDIVALVGLGVCDGAHGLGVMKKSSALGSRVNESKLNRGGVSVDAAQRLEELFITEIKGNWRVQFVG